MDELLRRYLTTKEARALKDALDDFTDSRYILSAFEAAAEDGEIVPGMDLSLIEQNELLSRYIGRAATSSEHHLALATDTADILQRVVEKALNHWPYTETKHVGLLSNLANPNIEKLGPESLVLPSFSDIRAKFRSIHVIPFLSDAAERSGLILPVMTDVYVMDALMANNDEGRLKIADRIFQLSKARQVQIKKKEKKYIYNKFGKEGGEGGEGNENESEDNLDALLPYESILALRNYFETRTMLSLYSIAFFKSSDDVKEQLEADRALEKVAAATIAIPGDAIPISSSFSGVLKDLSVPPCIQNKQAMKLAFASLQKLHFAASPQRKMDVIADTCDLLSGMLRTRTCADPELYLHTADDGNSTLNSKAHVDVVGADDLLPALMWLILYSARLRSLDKKSLSFSSSSDYILHHHHQQQPPPPLNLLAHCAYIERYRDQSQFSGRASYCLTHLRSCLQFLVTLGLAHGDTLTNSTENPSLPLMVMDIQVEEIVCKICGKNEHSKLSRLCVRCGHPLASSSAATAATAATTTTTTTTFSLSPSSLHLLSSQSINDFDSLPLAGRGVVV
jgi:hypothetical protein